MRRLSDIKTSNGITLQALINLLAESCSEQRLACLIVISELGVGGQDKATWANANFDKSLIPDALRQAANIISGQPSDVSRPTNGAATIVLTDVPESPVDVEPS